MLFVEAEDAGALFAGAERGDGCAGPEFEFAGEGAGYRPAGSGGVDEVEGFGAAGAAHFEGEESAEFKAALEASIEAGAAAGEAFEGEAGRLVGPDGFGGDAAGLGLQLLREAGDPEEGEEVAGGLHAGEDGGEEEVGDGGGLADAREAGEGVGVRGGRHRSSGPSLRSVRRGRGSGVRWCRSGRGGSWRR